LEQLDSSNKILESKVSERTATLEDQKQALEKSNDQIQHQNDELIKLNQELDNFVYSVSHDLKSPLASILGLIDLSKKEEDLNTLHHYHTLMEKSLNRQSEFISEILDYSRNARLESAKEPIDFKKMATASLEQFQFIEDFDKIEKKVLVDQKGEFFSDKQRISVILNNLISNALKYSSVGTESPNVEISIQADQEQAFISIIDNGCGIKEDKQEHIFEMFYRADDHKSGSGLGLYIVGETLQKLNAKVKLDSTYGEGTTVQVVIPSGK
jgi:signal transduction histidine kinase